MTKEHHRATVGASADLLNHWQRTDADTPLKNLSEISGLVEAIGLDKIKGWAAMTDDLDDVVVEKGLVDELVDLISEATCFQHFSFCGHAFRGPGGSLGEYGPPERKYQGFCWDHDPHLGERKLLTDITDDLVMYNEAFDLPSPGCTARIRNMGMIPGNKKWHDQEFPPAPRVAEIYRGCAKELRLEAPNDNSWKMSLCFALHLLQDMSVPHHVICTIFLDHGIFEDGMHRRWSRVHRRIFERDTNYKIGDLSMQVINHLENDLIDINSFESLGKRAVDLTLGRMPENRTYLEQEASAEFEEINDVERLNAITSARAWKEREAVNMTAQAVASTLKALDLFLSQ